MMKLTYLTNKTTILLSKKKIYIFFFRWAPVLATTGAHLKWNNLYLIFLETSHLNWDLKIKKYVCKQKSVDLYSQVVTGGNWNTGQLTIWLIWSLVIGSSKKLIPAVNRAIGFDHLHLLNNSFACNSFPKYGALKKTR